MPPKKEQCSLLLNCIKRAELNIGQVLCKGIFGGQLSHFMLCSNEQIFSLSVAGIRPMKCWGNSFITKVISVWKTRGSGADVVVGFLWGNGWSALLVLACSLQECASKGTATHHPTLKDLLPNCRGDRQPFVLVPKARQGSLSLTMATVTAEWWQWELNRHKWNWISSSGRRTAFRAYFQGLRPVRKKIVYLKLSPLGYRTRCTGKLSCLLVHTSFWQPDALYSLFFLPPTVLGKLTLVWKKFVGKKIKPDNHTHTIWNKTKNKK